MRRLNSRRDERGAAAVLFAITATVLFGFGAIAVDIGQAYAKRSLEQTDVDVAVMAAAAELTQPKDCNQAVVDKATEYLQKNDNAVSGQAMDAATGKVRVNLTNGDPSDGEISCPGNWKVELWAPASRADFSLASVIPGAPSGIDVNARAAAQIKAAKGGATLPFFAVDHCDYGQQSIRNDSQTPTTPPVPALAPYSVDKDNKATFSIVPPDQIPSGTDSVSITLTGNGFTGATAIGFTNAQGMHFEAAVTPTPTKDTTIIPVTIPNQVRTFDDVWYVRVKIPTAKGDSWSSTDSAQPLTIGPPKLYCDASNQGNFGTMDLPRYVENNFVLEWNIIKGVDPTLAINPSTSGECTSVISDKTPEPGTSCVATETGLKPAETNRGLVTGVGATPGRLDADSTSNCGRYGNNNRTLDTVLNTHINDDLLSCFITNGASIQQLVDSRKAGDPGYQALSADIFKSPRFFWIPVLATDPVAGKKYWPIQGFRPAFISDQEMSATKATKGNVSALDGLVVDNSGIRDLRVILFDASALPEFAPTVGGEADYTGTGPKALVLVE